MPWADFIRQEETPDLFDTVTPVTCDATTVTAKMLNLAADVLLAHPREPEGEQIEHLKTACAKKGVLYDGTTTTEALRRARGRVRR